MSDTQQMARMVIEQGMSYGEVGKKYGITRQAVHQRLVNAGLIEVVNERRVLNNRAYLLGLQTSHAQIIAGRSTAEKEAKKLGYAHEESYRLALWKHGLNLPPRTRELLGHGTAASYERGCRCDECRRANRERKRKLIGREPPNHGTESGYINYGCRCSLCTQAATAAARARNAKRLQEAKVNA